MIAGHALRGSDSGQRSRSTMRRHPCLPSVALSINGTVLILESALQLGHRF